MKSHQILALSQLTCIILSLFLHACNSPDKKQSPKIITKETSSLSSIDLDLPWVDLHLDLIDLISIHNSNDACSELILYKDEEAFPRIYIDSFFKAHIEYLNSEFPKEYNITNVDFKLCEAPTTWMSDTLQLEKITIQNSCKAFMYHCVQSKKKDFIFTYLRIPKLGRIYFVMYAKNKLGEWNSVSLGFPLESDFR